MDRRTKKATGIIAAIGGLFVLMAGIFMAVVSALAVTVALLPLRKQENREMIANEYNKAKENPTGYAQNVQEKAKSQMKKVKDDPKGYAKDTKSKVDNRIQSGKQHFQEATDKNNETLPGTSQ